jgi:predicted ATPase
VSTAAADRGPEGHDQTLVFVGVAAATIRLAQLQPLLLVVDDLHWADRASLDLFTHLALEIADTALREPVAVMIAATYREDARLPADVERLRREETFHDLTLRPLPAEEAGEMVRSLGLRSRHGRSKTACSTSPAAIRCSSRTSCTS